VSTYNHTYTFGFALSKSTDSDGMDVTPEQIRETIVMKLMLITDTELMENVGTPFTTYEESNKEEKN